MAKKSKSQKTEKVPKVSVLVSGIASFLDMGHPEGTHYTMTKLSKEVELKNSNPHPNTTRAKLSEGFLLKKVLKNWEETLRPDGMVDTIKKVEPREVNMATVVNMLVEINQKLDSIKAQVEKNKRKLRSI